MRMLTTATFRALALVGATLSGPLAAAAAPVYPWCVLQSGPCNNDCSYVTIEQCRAAASGVGTCYQNPAFTVASQAKPERVRR